MHPLSIVRLYCLMGSEITADMAGPITTASPQAVPNTATPNGWFESSDTSDTIAFDTGITPRLIVLLKYLQIKIYELQTITLMKTKCYL